LVLTILRGRQKNCPSCSGETASPHFEKRRLNLRDLDERIVSRLLLVIDAPLSAVLPCYSHKGE
jgi:hypothetical protein